MKGDSATSEGVGIFAGAILFGRWEVYAHEAYIDLLNMAGEEKKKRGWVVALRRHCSDFKRVNPGLRFNHLLGSTLEVGNQELVSAGYTELPYLLFCFEETPHLLFTSWEIDI